MSKRILPFILALLLLVGGCSAPGETGKTSTSETGTSAPLAAQPQTTLPLLFIQEGDLSLPVVKTEHFQFSRGEMVYLLSYFSSGLSSYGVDPVKSLKDQPFPGEEGRSWFDVILDEAISYAKDQLLFCEAAQARGIALEKAEEDKILEMKATAESAAASSGWDLETYFYQYYGTNIGWDSIEGVLRKSQLAQKLNALEFSSVSYSAGELEEAFQKNIKQYGMIDYYLINLGDGEAIPPELVERSRKSFEEAGNWQDFSQAVQSFLEGVKDPAEIRDAGGPEAYTEKYLSSALRTMMTYSESPFYDWAFSDASREGGIFLTENDQTKAPYAYYLLKKPYKNPAVLVDVRHILFKTGTPYATAQEARAMADQVYGEWVAGGASEEAFIALCAEYSADGNAASGGLYTNVYSGQMVAPFNDWCFDEARRPGDHGIVDTDFGSHMMYFVARHMSWETQVISGLQNEAITRLLEDQEKLTPVTVIKEEAERIEW